MINILIVMIGLTGLIPCKSFSYSGVISGFDLKQCATNTDCANLKAERAESGEWAPLMSLRNFNLQLTKNNKTVTYSGHFGYIDYSQNIIVLNTNQKKELTLNLKSMKLQEFN